MTRFAFVDAEKALFPVTTLCRLLRVSRSGYYAWARRAPSARTVADQVLTVKIETIFTANRRVYGAPRIHAELVEAGVHVSRKRVARLMRRAEIVGCHRRKRSFAITKQNPAAEPAPGPGRAPVLRLRAEPAVGRQRDLRADRAGMALPGLRHRRVLPHDPGLVDGAPPQDRPRRRRRHHGRPPPRREGPRRHPSQR